MVVIPQKLMFFVCQKVNVEDIYIYICWFLGVYSSMNFNIFDFLGYQDLCVFAIFAALSKTIESHNTVKNNSTK